MSMYQLFINCSLSLYIYTNTQIIRFFKKTHKKTDESRKRDSLDMYTYTVIIYM